MLVVSRAPSAGVNPVFAGSEKTLKERTAGNDLQNCMLLC